MTFNPDTLMLEETTQLWFELSETALTTAWQNSQNCSTPGSRWNAYLNRVCLDTFLPWLQEEYAPQAQTVANLADLPSIWEVVNGTAISFGGLRMVLIPTEAIDLSEMRIPQEWVDIPDWVADYYVAVQVNIDENSLRVWGYTTHSFLKNSAHYDASDRVYCLDQENLISDIDILWVARQICPDEITRLEVPALAAPAQTQADNLLQRLGNREVLTPRLEVPFSIWGALLANQSWTNKLYQQRQGMPQQWSITNWLQTGVSQLAQQTGWGKIAFEPAMASARGKGDKQTIIGKQLMIDGQRYELRISPCGEPTANTWRFELQNIVPSNGVPAGITLRLLTEDLQPFPNNEVQSKTLVKLLAVEVAFSEPGEAIVWEIEPTPDNYQRETLRF
ncbi:DUF1822 family protein [Calothrix sp. PCC 6303]|uniref:DUF1822 family protein n=1 Tax=Calothrix sp. PCC 6303 TaxID=1170562 RepID=UPI0002A014E2|nr:DUF1822 family protein [Calothrix sp. PCC 6303]AFY99666.1 protein of unknown function DUF1822 [Calothrix sp. PCC 6303]